MYNNKSEDKFCNNLNYLDISSYQYLIKLDELATFSTK